MWLSDNWKDYELIDCGRGEKLERWGDQLLVRPDPQAIWNTPRTHRGWKVNSGRYARSSTGGGQWQNKSMPERWTVSYRDLTFNIKPMNFKSMVSKIWSLHSNVALSPTGKVICEPAFRASTDSRYSISASYGTRLAIPLPIFARTMSLIPHPQS